MSKNYFFPLLASLLLLSGCFLPGYISGIPGSGKITTVNVPASGFTKVNQTAVGSVTIAQGDEESVSITTDDNLQPYIEAVVEKGELVIRNKSNQNLAATKGIKIDIKIKSLTALRLSGVGSITAKGLKEQTLSVNSDGVDSLTLAGEVDSLNVHVTGVGSFDSSGVNAKKVVLVTSGVGSSTVRATELLTVEASGVGSVTYLGYPKEKTIKATGIGKVSAGD